MFITKKYLSRRALLRGAGASLALPWLDAMIPAMANTNIMPESKAPHMGFIYFPHGAVMENWTPTQTGNQFELPPILSPLNNVKKYMTIVSGLRNKPAESPDPHGITAGTWLRCVAPRVKTNNSLDGITADQIAARTVGSNTTFPSLELSTVQGSASNGSFASTLSFRTPYQALPMESNPRKVFFRLFGYGNNATERANIINETDSLLDLVHADAKSLAKTLGAHDQQTLNDYLDSVRAIEKQVKKQQQQNLSSLNLPDAPSGIPDSFEDHLDIMFDLIALAWRAELTHVVSFMMDREVSMRTYNQIGVPDAFHPLSHHQNNPDKIKRLASVQAWNTQVFAKFAEKLANTPDGDGSLIDNSMILFGSNMSNSDSHNNDPLPSVLLGKARGKLSSGRHLQFEQDTPHANLLVSMLQVAGVPVDSFGDSTGRLHGV